MEKAVTTTGYTAMGAVLLIAGTCIGSGMIALPMVLSKVGLLPSIFLILAIWFLMYYTSLVNLELNLHAGKGLPLGGLARRFSGKIAELVGTGSLKLLSYSLLAVYLYGASSVIQELVASKMRFESSFPTIAACYSCAIVILFSFPFRWIDYFNRLLFIPLLAIIVLLILALAFSVKWSHIPLIAETSWDIRTWCGVIPVVFTSFGFQVIFHTLTNYCNRDAKVLKRVFLLGTCLPSMVYILWTATLLTAVHQESPLFYQKMAQGEADVGGLVQVLSTIAQESSTQLLIWWISLLAITTSILGVGAGLIDSLSEEIPSFFSHPKLHRLTAALLAIVPTYLAVIFIPNAFIAILGFAGMILAIIAVILPLHLLWKIQDQGKIMHYEELTSTQCNRFCLLAAYIVILSELIHAA